jgi:hypothetical protein
MMHGKDLNPSISRGDGEILGSYLDRIHEYISKLEWQSDGHIRWYTHKNPYGCWICELAQVCRSLEAELMAYRGDNGTGTQGNQESEIDNSDHNENT